MKILFIHNKYQYKGGEDTALESETALLMKHGYQVHTIIFTNYHIGATTSKAGAALRSIFNKKAAAMVTKEVRDFKPDVIHVHNIFFTASPSVLYAARKAGVPVVMTIHNYRMICANALLLRNNKICEKCTGTRFPVYGALYKCYRSSAIESALVSAITGIHKTLKTWNKTIDRIIVLTEFMRNRLIDSSFNFPAERMTVKPNFVEDFTLLKEVTPREEFLLFAGRLSPEKGIETLLTCFRSTPNIRLVIAGDGPLKEMVEETAKQHPHIEYVGHQGKEAMLNLIQRCRALVFPSVWYEGMPLTIVEAFCAGTPVIASHLGAMASMIIDGYNGFHFTAGDATALRDAISRLYRRPVTDLIYQQARQSYLDHYTPEQHHSHILDIYMQAIKQSPPINPHH